MLIIFGGLPGVGKSTIAKMLAAKLHCVYIRIDSIEQAIKNASKLNDHYRIEILAEGYMTAYAIAKDNLDLGLTVITDSVNPIEITRNEFRKVATHVNVTFLEIEVICSDKIKHKTRIETRKPTILGLELPSWQDVLSRDYEPWKTKHLTIDTASTTPEDAVSLIISELNHNNC